MVIGGAAAFNRTNVALKLLGNSLRCRLAFTFDRTNVALRRNGREGGHAERYLTPP